jgi:hypothetical protein
MAIVPSGTKRTMIAQVFGRNNEMGLGELSGMENVSIPQQETQPQIPPQTDQVTEQKPQNIEQPQQEAENDLTSYMVNKLQEMGYPPRRLTEFEDKIVEEKILPGEIREVTVVIPDRYYGSKKRISGKDMAKMVKEIQAKFGLNFTGADRKEKKITMNFTSQAINTGEEEVVGDYLDEVYGTPSNTTNKKRRNAQTMQEMLKTGKSVLYEIIKKIGDKNDSKK